MLLRNLLKISLLTFTLGFHHSVFAEDPPKAEPAAAAAPAAPATSTTTPITIEQKIEVHEAKAVEEKAEEPQKEEKKEHGKKACCKHEDLEDQSNHSHGGGGNTSVSGYIDAQFRWAPADDLDASPSISIYPEDKNTFLINSGAFKISHRVGRTHAHLDIPFRRDDDDENSNTLVLAEDYAQAYVTHYYDHGFWWTLGQFDTAFGFEANDSNEILFTRQGLLYNIVTRGIRTHTGLLLGYHNHGFTVNVIAANSNQNGIHGAGDDAPGTTKDEEFAYGLKLGWKNEEFRGSLGGLFNTADGKYNDGVDDENFETETLLDVQLGWTAHRFDLDLVFNSRANLNGRGKDAGEDIDPINGLLVQTAYKLCERTSTHFRYEQVEENMDDEAIGRAALGFNFNTSDSTQVKAEVAYNQIDNGDEDDDYWDGGLGVVYNF